MVSIYWEWPSRSIICRARVMKMRATIRAMVQPAKKPENFVLKLISQSSKHELRVLQMCQEWLFTN